MYILDGLPYFVEVNEFSCVKIQNSNTNAVHATLVKNYTGFF